MRRELPLGATAGQRLGPAALEGSVSPPKTDFDEQIAGLTLFGPQSGFRTKLRRFSVVCFLKRDCSGITGGA